MSHGLYQTLAKEKQRLARMAASLDALSPLKVMGRGYSIAMNEEGRVLTSVQEIDCGEVLDLRMQDGMLTCRVEERMCRSWQQERK